MNRFLLVLFLINLALLLHLTSSAQTTKNNWLLGGAGSLSIRKNTLPSMVMGKQTEILIDGRIGYFVANNFVFGLTPMWQHIVNDRNNRFNNFLVGPFVRGYLLPKEKNSNLFLGAGLGYFLELGNSQSNSDKFTLRRYLFEAGYVYFLNQNVGVEVISSYDIWNSKNMEGHNSNLNFKIGFQLYLQKDK